MVTCIRKEIIFISKEDAEKRGGNLELIHSLNIFLQPEFAETRTLQEQYEDRLRELLEEKDADCVVAPKRFIKDRDHTAIFYRDNRQRGKLDAYAGRILC